MSAGLDAVAIRAGLGVGLVIPSTKPRPQSSFGSTPCPRPPSKAFEADAAGRRLGAVSAAEELARAGVVSLPVLGLVLGDMASDALAGLPEAKRNLKNLAPGLKRLCPVAEEMSGKHGGVGRHAMEKKDEHLDEAHVAICGSPAERGGFIGRAVRISFSKTSKRLPAGRGLGKAFAERHAVDKRQEIGGDG